MTFAEIAAANQAAAEAQQAQMTAEILPLDAELQANAMATIIATHFAVVLVKSETSTMTDEEFQALLTARGMEGMQ